MSVTKMGSFTNPFEIVGKALLEAVKSLKEPMIATVLFLVVVLFYAPNSSLAASGGRMGGSRFSSASSSTSSPSRTSSSRSSPSRSYSSRSSPSRSSSSSSGGGSTSDDLSEIGLMLLLLLLICVIIPALQLVLLLIEIILHVIADYIIKASVAKTSILKLQVGLMGSARSLQKELNRIAETTDTSKEEGLIYILRETTVAMLRHPDYWISGYSSVYLRIDIEECEEKFYKITIEERGKFDEETLVNVDNLKRESKSTKESTGLKNEYIVVTILVAAKGTHELPAISSHRNLKEALEKLGSIAKDKILAVEVLWTPQVEDDSLTEKELLEDYPLLQPL